ncbi:MAG: cell elongation specific D,D-transpeptidase, partial [Parcubacteria bacterium 33_209]
MLRFFQSRGYQKFKIKRRSKDIDTEEIFLDALEHRKDKGAYTMETALSQRIFQLTFGLFLVLIVFFFLYSFNLQVFSYEEYSAKAESNKYLSKQINAQRGIIYDRSMNQLAFNAQQFDLIYYVDETLREKEIREVARILEIPFYELMENISQKESGTLLVARGIEKEKAIILKTKEKELSSFELITKNTREYLDGNNFSHILGYVSGDTFNGEAGIERQYNEYLKEDPGVLYIERDALGRKIEEEIIESPKSGNNLVLNIDFDLQKKVSEYLDEVVSGYNASGGAVIAMNPQTGEVLSLASNPSFDSNIFSKNLTTAQFNQIVSSPNVSFYNRAIAGEYSFASTIKPMIGVAALEENIITPDQSIYCDEKIELSDGTFKSDWKFHGWTDLKKAIAESSNVFFYHLGGGYKNFIGLGIEKIEKYLQYFGLGKLSQIDLPGEKKGLIPNPTWKSQLNG